MKQPRPSKLPNLEKWLPFDFCLFISNTRTRNQIGNPIPKKSELGRERCIKYSLGGETEDKKNGSLCIFQAYFTFIALAFGRFI